MTSLVMSSLLWLVIACMAPSVSSLGVTLLHGDIYIQFVAAFYDASGLDGSCSSIDAEVVQNMHAVKWTLTKLNEVNYIDGVKIGLLVQHTCQKQDEDKRVAMSLATEIRENNKTIVGVIGPDYSSEAESFSRLLSSLPLEYRLLQLGYSATSASLRDRSTFKNFFRTIPPDDIQVTVMRELIMELNWTYMAIVYNDDAYGQGGIDALLKSTKGLDVCFPASIPISQQNNSVQILEDIIKNRILEAEIPISGVLIFGSATLAENVLTATENVLNANTALQAPVFLFSEAGTIIVGQKSNVSRGAYVLTPRRKAIKEFQDYWRGLLTSFPNLYAELPNDKWLKDLYLSKFQCSLASAIQSNTCPELSLDQVTEALPISVYNQYAIQAALVMAKVTKEILVEKCGNNQGTCSDFVSTSVTKRNEFIEKLKTMTVRFDYDFNNFRIEEFQKSKDGSPDQYPDLVVEFNQTCEVVVPDQFPIYEVYNQREEMLDTRILHKVAEYFIKNGLVVHTGAIKDYDSEGNELSWPNIRKPQCPDGEVCSKCVSDLLDHSVLFLPGDMYVVGVVPIHNQGTTPLKCGNMKPNGLDLAEAIRFAVNEAKVTPNARIGVIVIDSCNDPQLIQEKILSLHKFGVLINGQYIPVRDKILGYIGGWSSDVSKAVAELTSRLGYAQISYASTAVVLSRRSLYPYFLRTPTPDDQQAELLLKIAKQFGADLIQVLYSATEYGEGGRDIILQQIKSKYQEICIGQTIPVSMSSKPREIIQKLRNVPRAKIVIVFVGSFEVNHIFSELRNLNRNEFLFIASEGWGTRFPMTGYNNLIGTITVSSELTINQKLKDHMKSLRPDNTDVDPWIRSYIEHEFHCYFEWSYNKTSGQQCQGDERLDVFTTGYRIDSWSPFAERAVSSLLEVAKQVLELKCGGSSTQLCSSFKMDPKTFVDRLTAYRYDQGDTQSLRLYDDNGDGTAGYTIYTVTLDQTGEYKKIGVQEPGAFTFQTQVYHDIRGEVINSSCSPAVAECKVCFPATPTVAESKNLSTAIIVVNVLLGIVCCVLAGILLFICNRNGCCFKLENGRLKLTSPYLTPVYIQDRSLHGIDGCARDMRLEEHYDSIPHSVTSYARSNSTMSGGRMPTSDGSSSSTDRGPPSGGSIMTRPNRYEDMAGRDNMAFENEQSRGSGTGRQSDGSNQAYLAASPPPHAFINPKPAAPTPPAPTPASNVVYQDDGSYITATHRQESKESKISAGSQTDLGPQFPSASSDKSLGYLSQVKLAVD